MRTHFNAVRFTVVPWTGPFSADDLREIADVASACGGEIDLESSTHESVAAVVPDTMADEFGDAVEALDNVSYAQVMS